MHVSTRLKQTAALAATAAAAVTFVVSNAPAGASSTAPHWAAASSATIHPGVQMFTKGAQCTGNFVFAKGSTVYVGYAAHCAGTGSETDTNGCQTASLPLGTKVSFNQGANLAGNGTKVGTGKLVYSSWLAMKNAHETNANTCAYNDLALVQVDAKYLKDVNPSVPFWGGPDKLATSGTSAGDTIYSYGNSLLRAGVEELSPKQGLSLGDDAGGWTHTVYTVSPGVPGDSGSGFMDANGNALGVLSTIELAPEAGSNGVGDLPKELAYANSHGMAGVHLVAGTQKFAPIV
jgi:hypothetical protein